MNNKSGAKGNRVQIQIDEYFDCRGKHLGRKGQTRDWKYCNICGEEVQADILKLRRHCGRQHKTGSGKSYEIDGFLLRG